MSNVKKSNTGNKVIKAGIWYTFSNFLLRGVGFLTTPLFTRVLSKSEYGDFNNFTSWMSLLMILTTLDLYTSINRARFDFEDDIDGYISSIAVLGTLFTAICYLVVITFSDFFISLFSMEYKYIHIMFIYLLVSPVMTLLQTKHRLYQEYKFFVFISIFSTLISVGLSVIFVLTFSDKLFGRIVGYVAPLLIINIIIYLYITFKGRKISLYYWRYGLFICVPLIPHVLGGNILGTSDRLLIQKICGANDLALYSLAYSCSLIVSVLWTSMNQAWAPWLMENLHQKNYKVIKKRSKQYLFLFLSIGTSIILLAPEVVYILGGKVYLQAKYVMPPVIMGCMFQFAYSMYVNIEIYEKKTWLISLGTMLAAVANILLNMLLIPIFGYIAAAYTTLICYALLLVFHFLSVKRLRLDICYDNRFIFAILTLELFMMVIITYLYSNNIIRYVVTGVYITTLMVCALGYKKTVIALLKK
ncbi:oligosaccharide flippase family protein [Clostridium sp.]|uniref:lipopolysaccharide biosynthesis protein n=1 Tax=Clostridium sp. TaxID=1506 RepID=UPI003216A9BD